MTIFRVAETGSTNTDMLERAVAGTAHEGDWLVAERQTVGRGRSGRAWASPTGNLYASGLVELRPSDPPAPTLALVAGIAAVETLGGASVILKWPNDILRSCESRSPANAGNAQTDTAPASAGAHAKLAGILLEREGDAVVVGVGANLVHAPEVPGRAVTSLVALERTLSVDEAAAALARTMTHWLAVWRTDFASIRSTWLDRAHPLGTPLSAALSDGGRIDGRFDGLTEDCALRLALADGSVRVIHAGDVFLI